METGFDVDISDEIASRLGLEVVWVKADFDTIFTALAGDQFDMVAAASTITDEREQVVDFSVPYYNALQSLTVNTQETPDITSTDQLGDGDVVGVQKGTTGKIWAEENLVPQGVELKTFTASPDSFRDLEAGNVVGVINDKTASVEIVKDLPALAVVQDIDTDEHYGFAFSPSNPELREAVNFVFGQMVADGTYATIYGKYFPPDSLPAGVRADGLTNRSVGGSALLRADPFAFYGGVSMAVTEAPPFEPEVATGRPRARRPRCRRRSSRWASPRWSW